MALCVVLHEGLAEVVGAGIYLEEAVASLVGAVEQCRERTGDTFQVETSAPWASYRAACSEPCMVDLVACLEGMPLAFLAGVVTWDRAEMGGAQSGYCGSGCGQTTAQEDRRSRIGWRHRDHVRGGS